MSATTQDNRPWTSDELCRLPKGWRYEIDEGELVIMAPAGLAHGDAENRVAYVLTGFVQRAGLGQVFTGEVGFRLQAGPETLRGADVAFISNDRLSRIADRKGFSSVAPDLAVEVHDPSEPDLSRKVKQYLAAGVRAVWVVDPGERRLSRHAPDEDVRVWSDPGSVVVEPVLPGFSCHLQDLFGDA